MTLLNFQLLKKIEAKLDDAKLWSLDAMSSYRFHTGTYINMQFKELSDVETCYEILHSYSWKYGGLACEINFFKHYLRTLLKQKHSSVDALYEYISERYDVLYDQIKYAPDLSLCFLLDGEHFGDSFEDVYACDFAFCESIIKKQNNTSEKLFMKFLRSKVDKEIINYLTY
jgi:hypothetical protein